MHRQRISALKPDAVSVAGIEGHEVRPAPYLLRPAGHVVAKLEEDVVGKRIEIVLAVRIFRKSLHDDGEERIEPVKRTIIVFGHLRRKSTLTPITLWQRHDPPAKRFGDLPLSLSPADPVVPRSLRNPADPRSAPR